MADLLLEDVQEHPRQWQLHGALLAEIDRVLDELDIEERTKRLGEELDRRSAEAHARRPRLRALARRLGRQPACRSAARHRRGCGGGRSLVRWGAEVPASKEW
ncbi:hypothetical protein SCALM49S_04877 [Streptomyces californicus]